MYGAIDPQKRDDLTLSEDLSQVRSILSRRSIFFMIFLVASLAGIVLLRIQEATESQFQNMQFSDEIPSHTIEEVTCGVLDLMKLSCRVTVKADAMSKVFLQYAPMNFRSSKCTSTICVAPPGELRTKTFEISQIGLTSIDFYRLRPDTAYILKLYVFENEGHNRLADNSTFVTKGTGYHHFDHGPLTEVAGWPHYPLLQFPLHTDSFRGVVVTDEEGYLVWYYNTSATNVGGSHLEAVEQSNLHHVWCINDQGFNSGTGKQISIIDVAGTILAIKKWDHRVNSDNFPTGHECRFVDGHTDGEMSKRVLTLADHAYDLKDGEVDHIVYQGTVYDVAEVYDEYIHVLSADNNNKNLKHESNVSLTTFLNLRTLMKYYDAAKISQIDYWDDLVLEFSPLINSNEYSLRYLHASSVSISDDGTTYVATFRDAAVVVGIYKSNHTKRFLVSSIIPDVATHEFDNEYHKFYTPHDASFYGNDTLCLVDDGLGRPEGDCIQDNEQTCFSRGVCYTLHNELKVIQLAWEFEYKYDFHGGPITEFYEEMDLYNMNGGSLRRIGKTYWTLSFTSVDTSMNNSGYVFGINQTDTHKQMLTSIVTLPKCHIWASTDGTSGEYRASPIMSLDGERYAT